MNSNELIMQSIKIGSKEYKIEKGDYILDNGACFQFCSGDNRILRWEDYSKYRSIVIPKQTMKKIPLNEMQVKTNSSGSLKYYYF